MSEVKYPCVFGLGECLVAPNLLELAKEVRARISVERAKVAVPPEHEELMELWHAIAMQYVMAMLMSSRGTFCQACIELKKLRGEIEKVV